MTAVKPPRVTEITKVPGRGHALTIEGGLARGGRGRARS